jgi:hypothetical protein
MRATLWRLAKAAASAGATGEDPGDDCYHAFHWQLTVLPSDVLRCCMYRHCLGPVHWDTHVWPGERLLRGPCLRRVYLLLGCTVMQGFFCSVLRSFFVFVCSAV